MLIANIIAKRNLNVLTISQNDNLKNAALVLTDKKIGALPVVDDKNKLVGIISERDIVRICASENKTPMESLVKNAMTTKLEVASMNDSIDSALARMTDRRIRHLPVVDSDDLIGIVSIGDLVKAQIDEALREADAMRAYIHS